MEKEDTIQEKLKGENIKNINNIMANLVTLRRGRVEAAAGKGERKATPRLAMLYTQRMQTFRHPESTLSDTLKAGFQTARKQAFGHPESRLSDNNGGISSWKNILKIAAMCNLSPIKTYIYL